MVLFKKNTSSLIFVLLTRNYYSSVNKKRAAGDLLKLNHVIWAVKPTINLHFFYFLSSTYTEKMLWLWFHLKLNNLPRTRTSSCYKAVRLYEYIVREREGTMSCFVYYTSPQSFIITFFICCLHCDRLVY